MSSIDPTRPALAGALDVTRPPSEVEVVFRSIGPYRLLQKIGEGGMGEVWLAEQTQPLRRQVALKVIKAGMDTAQVVARFEAERQALAVMDHPNIAKVFDGGSTLEGRPYFVMEYVRGEPISDFCDRVKMPLRERLELFATLCDGVQHAHQKGIIHRDLKPSNVLVSEIGDRPAPRIIDFGIAKATAQRLTDTPMYTEIGSFMGTPEYMSPEQVDMTLDVDTRSDVYSLGMILYQLLSGTLPFDSETLRSGSSDDLKRLIREKEPARPSTRLRELKEVSAEIARCRAMSSSKLAAALRGELDWVTLKAIEKDRSRRYSTANALALDVRRYLQKEPVAAGPPSASYRASKFVQRNRFAVAGTAIAIVALLIVVAALAVQSRRLIDERDRANQEAATAAQVTDFLINLFNVSDPSEARGNALTAREVLSKGASELQNSLQNTPRLRTRLQTAIGTVFINLGLLTEAQAILEPAVSTSEAALGKTDVDSVAAANALATLAWHRREYERAARLYNEVLTARKATLGEFHAKTLETQFDLATTYLQMSNQFDRAEMLLKATLDAQRSTLGDKHPNTISTLNALQNVLFRQKRYDEALPIAEQVWQTRVQTGGADHPGTLNALHNYAMVLRYVGRLEQSEGMLSKVLEDRRRVLGSQHPNTIGSRLEYARVLRARQRYADATRELHGLLDDVGTELDPARTRVRDLALDELAQIERELNPR